jgi:D-glycero-D-manno-heptose 1,7-bisphosphate phosphatase
MILDAVNEYKIDIEHSIMIGDKERDIEAAINAGIKITYLLDENKSVEKSKATKIVSSLKEIIDVNFK